MTTIRTAILNTIRTEGSATNGRLSRLLNKPEPSIRRETGALVTDGLLNFIKRGGSKVFSVSPAV